MSGTLKLSEQWRPLRQDMGNLICSIDGKTEKIEAEERRMEQKRDESYQQGAEDMLEAVNMLYDSSKIGLCSEKMEELFGTVYIRSILDRHSAIEIINGLKKFLEEKEQDKDFHIGDEVECIDSYYANYKEKYVVVETFKWNDQKAIRLINLRNVTLHETTCPEGYRKTGKRYTSILIPKEEGEET